MASSSTLSQGCQYRKAREARKVVFATCANSPNLAPINFVAATCWLVGGNRTRLESATARYRFPGARASLGLSTKYLGNLAVGKFSLASTYMGLPAIGYIFCRCYGYSGTLTYTSQFTYVIMCIVSVVEHGTTIKKIHLCLYRTVEQFVRYHAQVTALAARRRQFHSAPHPESPQNIVQK